ncbi:MAG: hypothetical protein WDN50_07625 [Bradyrhizobium sp.]
MGRKAMLTVSLIVKGTATVLIGCLPTYAEIGIWAAVLLDAAAGSPGAVVWRRTGCAPC